MNRMYWEAENGKNWDSNKWNQWVQKNYNDEPNLKSISDKLDLIIRHFQLDIVGEEE